MDGTQGRPSRLRALAWAGAAVLAIVVGALAVDARRTEANDIAPFQTVFATDAVSAGLGGIRGLGSGDITLSGVSGTVTQALLYWHGPTDSDVDTENADITFGGSAVTGTNIGFSSDNCWGFTNSQAYRADVTSLVTGDGAYTLEGLVQGAADVNGASLIVFFDDGDDQNNRDVVLFDGNDSNVPDNGFDADGWNVSLPGINYESGTAAMELHVSDGQSFDDDALVLNAATLDPGPEVFQGDSVPNGPNDNSGGLWDIATYDVTSALTPGDNTLTLTTGQLSDCLSLIVAAINLPAGAAPGQPTPAATDTPAAPTDTPAPGVTPTATAAAISLPTTGAGSGSTGTPGWLIAALAGASALAAGYGALRLRTRRA